MLKRLDELLGPALETVTCERGHRMLHGEPECLRCPEPPKPGVHPEDAKPEILNDDGWLLAARERLEERARVGVVPLAPTVKRSLKPRPVQPLTGDGQCAVCGDPTDYDHEVGGYYLRCRPCAVDRAAKELAARKEQPPQTQPDERLAKLLDSCSGYQTPHSEESIAHHLIPKPEAEPERKPRSRSKRFRWRRSR